MSAAMDDEAPRLSVPPAVEQAIALVRAGYYVAPVTIRRGLDGRKRPTYHGRWATISTRDERQVYAWAAEHGRGLGFAIDCEASGIAVVDLDVKPTDGIDAVAWWESEGLPQGGGFVVETPSQGVHLYFRQRADDPISNSAGKIAPGVDVRGVGGHVFAPGTSAVGEHERPWRPCCDLPPVEALDVLSDAIVARIPVGSRKRERSGTPRAEGDAHNPLWIEGELRRQRRLVGEHDAEPGSGFRAVLRGASLMHGRAVAAGLIERERAVRLLRKAVVIAWGAVDEDDETWIDTGLDDGEADPWTIVPDPETSDPSPEGHRADSDGSDEDDDSDDDEVVSSWAEVDLVGLFDGTHVMPKAAFLTRCDGERAFYRGLTHSIHGESESGKSWVAQWAVIETLARGERALYVDFESSADQIVFRLKALGLQREWLERLTYVNPDTAADHAFRALLKHSFDLAVIDGVTAAIAAWGGASNSQDDVTLWSKALPERLAKRTGAAVVVIDHVGKANDGRGRFAIGSQAKMATLTGSGFYADVGTMLAPGSIGRIRLYVGKDRPGDVRSHAGPMRKDRLQHWATFVLDATKPLIEVSIESWEDNEDDATADLGFEIAEQLPWSAVIVPDEIGEHPTWVQGKGQGTAHEIIRIMYRSGTMNGLTKGEVQTQYAEGLKGDKRKAARSRFGYGWACLDRGLALASNGARYSLDPAIVALLDQHNAQ